MKKIIGILVLVGALFGFIFMQPAFALTYSDTFDGSTLNTSWWTPLVSGGNTLTVTGGQLVMTQDNLNGNSEIIFKIKLRGDFDVHVDYDLLTWPSSNYERIGIGTTAIGAVERAQHPGWYDEAYVTHFAPVGDGVYTVSTADTSGKLRMERSGNTVTGYYWNGLDWTTIHSYTNVGVSDDTDLVLSIWNGYASVPVAIAFDNFYLNAPAIPEPATMLLLGLGLVGLAGIRKRFRM